MTTGLSLAQVYTRALQGIDAPQVTVEVCLAPADLTKHGARYDLAIAVGILVASGQLLERAVIF